MSSRVQAEQGDGADKEQERHRSYLLRRLLPPLAAQVVEGFTADDIPAGNMLALAPRSAKQRLDACTTAQLEREFACFYDLLLMVRIALVLRASAHVMLLHVIIRACRMCFRGHLPCLSC